MTFRRSERPARVARFALRFGYLAAGIAAATAVSGCPDGAELENPDRFIQYGGTAGTVGTTGGTGGATGGTGGAAAGTGGATGGTAGAGGATGGSAGMAMGGAAGSSAGSGMGATGGYPCDVRVALSKSCARTGCHSAIDHYADLDLSNPETVGAQLYNKPAMHGDINCAATGMPFRECMPAELPATCPQGALLIDPVTFENSWVYKKIMGDETCGDAMPLPPGNSVSNGWDAAGARRDCLIDFFRKITGP
jgi:hypothetical protein